MEYVYLSYPSIGNLGIMIIIIYKDSIYLLVKSYFENNFFNAFHKSDILIQPLRHRWGVLTRICIKRCLFKHRFAQII